MKRARKNTTVHVITVVTSEQQPNSGGGTPVSGKPVQRLSLDLPTELHTRLKMHCVSKQMKMNEFVFSLIEHALGDGR